MLSTYMLNRFKMQKKKTSIFIESKEIYKL